jgi:hypothetical protein
MADKTPWPSLEELELQRRKCQQQIAARMELLHREIAARMELPHREHSSIDKALSYSKLVIDDRVLKNLKARLETYVVDIERMEQHELVSFYKAELGPHVWVCACRATGSSPTSRMAMEAWTEHVYEAVWGA